MHRLPTASRRGQASAREQDATQVLLERGRIGHAPPALALLAPPRPGPRIGGGSFSTASSFSSSPDKHAMLGEERAETGEICSWRKTERE